jgi:probable HAF family extracellular repeat protein
MFKTSMIVVAACALAAASYAQYSFTAFENISLPNFPLPGDSTPSEISNSGAISGGFTNYDAEGNESIFGAYSIFGGSPSALEVLAPGDMSRANGINDLGVVVGYSGSSAVRWDAGVVTALEGLPDGSDAVAVDINNAGIILGAAQDSNFEQQIVTWSGAGSPTILTIPTATYVYGYSIGNGGHIAGVWASGPGGRVQGFVALNGAITNLGYLAGGTSSFAEEVNTFGVIAGSANSPDGWRAVISSGSSLVSLGVADGFTSSLGFGINDAGQVVGRMSDGSVDRAFLYSNGQMQDLNVLAADALDGWVLLSAQSINNSGQIVGVAQKDDEFRSYLLTPVPEPATLTVVALAALLRRRKATKKS